MDSLENDQEEVRHQPRVSMSYGSVATSPGSQDNRKMLLLLNQILLILLDLLQIPSMPCTTISSEIVGFRIATC